MQTDRIPDLGERRRAILTESHAFVWASAGTGKTHALTLRALYLLLKNGGSQLFVSSRADRVRAARAAIRSVVLMTFTRKAAAEMQTRLARYLDLVANTENLARLLDSVSDALFEALVETILENIPGKDVARLRAGAETLVELMPELQVSTMHSFAASILRRHPLEAALPAECRLAREDEDDLSEFEDALVERWWQAQVVASPRMQADLAAVLGEVPIDDVNVWLRLLLNHPWILERVQQMSPAGDEEKLRLTGALSALAELLSALPGQRLKRTGSQLKQLLSAENDLPDWTALASYLRENRVFLFDRPGRKLTEALRKLSEEESCYLYSFDRLYSTLVCCAVQEGGQRAIWKAWINILRGFNAWARGAGARDLKLVTFDDMMERAVKLLRSAHVTQIERKPLRAVLVDEFQDTDKWQLEMLRHLLSRTNGSQHEVLGFFVGDEKQSIYRFRGSDVRSIRRFCDRFELDVRTSIGKEEFQLQTSFRSVCRVIDFTNAFFSEAIPLTRQEETLKPFRKDRGQKAEWVRILPAQDQDKGHFSAEEARRAAALAVVSVVDEYLAAGGERSYRDILVLTRDNRDLNVLLATLAAAGVPAIASGAKSFYGHPEVLDVLNLLICLCSPGDSLAVAAVLRSPLVGLSEELLFRLLEVLDLGRLCFSSDPLPDFVPESARFRIFQLRELARARTDLYLLDWLERVLRFVPLAPYLDSTDQEGRAPSRIERVVRSFGEECLRGTLPPLVWLLKQRGRVTKADRWDANLGEDIALADETIDAVRAMTIHKAKGLEGELVLIFDWNELLKDCCVGPRRRGARVLDMTQENFDRLREFRLPWGKIEIRSPGFREAQDLERIQEREEAERLAYVAVTRARSQVVMLSPGTHPWEPTGSLEDFVTYADSRDLVRFRNLSDTAQGRRSTTVGGHWMDIDAYRRLWQRRMEVAAVRERLIFRPSQDDELGQRGPLSQMVAVAAGARPRSSRSSAHLLKPFAEQDINLRRTAGVLVHAYLERSIHREVFEQEQLAQLAAEIGLFDPRMMARAERILRRFYDGVTKDPSGVPYVERVRKAKTLGREVPLFLHYAGQNWHGIVDLILDEGEQLSGVDFKTGFSRSSPFLGYQRQREIYLEGLTRLAPDRRVGFEFWWLAKTE